MSDMGELSTREEIVKGIRFICCDNLPFMREIDMGYFHVGIVDPPYGVEAHAFNMGKTSAERAKLDTVFNRGSWDGKIPSKEYFDQLRRITRQQVIWGGNYFLDFLPATECCMIWDKEQAEGLGYDDFELAWTSLKTKNMICRRHRVKDAKIEKIHTTQKPVYLYKWIFSKLISAGYLKKGQRVLDTHGGSHNIAIAAYDYGMELTILEINLQYHLDGIEHFKKYTIQGALSL